MKPSVLRINAPRHEVWISVSRRFGAHLEVAQERSRTADLLGPAILEARMIKFVGGVPVLPKHRLSCHCGTVILELQLPDGIVDPRRCDCSLCRRKGAIVASVGLSAITIIQGEDALKLYQFNTQVARHYFCANCGIYTHHQRRSFPDQYGYNVGCLEGINPFDLEPVQLNDGVNHPADRHP